MADVDGSKVLEFLKEKWGGRTCPMCSKGPLAINPKTFQLTEFNEGSLVIGGPVFPVIPVSCENCGHMILVSAIKVGAINPNQTAEKNNG